MATLSHSIINEHHMLLNDVDFLGDAIRFTVVKAAKPDACQQSIPIDRE